MLDESGRRAGANRWIESRCFEVVGGWVPATAETFAQLTLDRHSRHHAWRAGQWWDRLPVLADIDRPSLCAPPTLGWAAALDALALLGPTAERLTVLYRVVLPRLHARYSRQLAELDTVGDSSTGRTLRIVLTDLATDWQEGEDVLEQVLDGRPGAIAQAMAAAAGIEGLLART